MVYRNLGVLIHGYFFNVLPDPLGHRPTVPLLSEHILSWVFLLAFPLAGFAHHSGLYTHVKY